MIKILVLLVFISHFAFVNAAELNSGHLPLLPNSKLRINQTIDLNGDTIVLPEKLILLFENGGRLVNGALIGNKTQIDGVTYKIFDNIIILGSWAVSDVSPLFFEHPYEMDVLKQVIALTSDSIQNRIIIPPGNYPVQVEKGKRDALNLRSKTDMVIEGNIFLAANSLIKYSIINISHCSEVNIRGFGAVIGDKHNHLGNDGEWGHGLNILESSNITVKDITVKDCWGDCVYIGEESRKVILNYCKLDNGRRQGISITSANDIYVSDCLISNVSGTIPQCAIDIETNKGTQIDSIFIKRVKAENCYGGFQIWGKAEDSKIGQISISDCYISKIKTEYAMRLSDAEKVVVENCIIDSDNKISILFESCKIASSINNFILSSNRNPIRYNNCNILNK